MKCGLYGLLFAVLSIGLSVGYSNTAKALPASIPNTSSLLVQTDDPPVTQWSGSTYDSLIELLRDEASGVNWSNRSCSIDGGLNTIRPIIAQMLEDKENTMILNNGTMQTAEYSWATVEIYNSFDDIEFRVNGDNYEYRFPNGARALTIYSNPNNGYRFSSSGVNNRCNVIIDDSWRIMQTPPDSQFNQIFHLKADNITYPSGYNGEQVPNKTHDPNAKVLLPAFNYVLLPDGEIQLTYSRHSDQAFFDEYDGQEFDFVIRLMEYDNSDPPNQLSNDIMGEITADQLFSGSVMKMQIPDHGTWVILISPSDQSEIVLNNGWTVKAVAIQFTHDGSIMSGSTVGCNGQESNGVIICHEKPLNWSTCMTEAFPFINLGECMKNLQLTYQKLQFDVVNFGTPWKPVQGCRELVVLGSWLSMDNVKVCPFFDEDIRSVVTPFVTFILGLITFNLVMSWRSGD